MNELTQLITEHASDYPVAAREYNPITVTTISGYDPVELSIGASRLLNTDATEHELARLINSELERGVLVAYWQRLSNGVYGYYVRMAEL